jgi:hypothetical protein
MPKDKWQSHIDECARICASGGWVEILETDLTFLGGGAGTHQFSEWMKEGLKARNVEATMVRDLDVLMSEAGLINVQKHIFILPFGNWGGRAGELFMQDFKQASISFQSLFTNVLGVSKEQVEANADLVMKEFESFKVGMRFYAYIGQKK